MYCHLRIVCEDQTNESRFKNIRKIQCDVKIKIHSVKSHNILEDSFSIKKALQSLLQSLENAT